VKSRLKWYLPVLEVGVSLVLGLWGDWQTQRLLRQLGTSHVWDYVAPAEMVMHLINLPAMLACTLTLSRSFQIGIEYASVCGLSHFCCCALVFSGMVYPGLSPVGLFQTLYREGTASLRSSPRRVTILLGAILLKGPWPLSILFPLGFILWGIAFIVLFSRKAASSDGV